MGPLQQHSAFDQMGWEPRDYWGDPGGGPGSYFERSARTGWQWQSVQWYPDVPAPQAATSASTSTGVAPTETSYALYGHIIPLSVFGKGTIGGDIISGPFVENGLATFCISFGVPADPYGTRTLREIAFDSEVVWENGAFNVEAFTFRFYPGRLDQAVDPVETLHWGADAVAYRPQILLWFENLPIKNTKFQKIPYVAALLGDSSGDDVNLGEAFERLATSPWVGYTSAEFESVGVTDGLVSGGLIFAQDAEFLSTIQQFGRFYRNWNILQTDKLRIVDRGAVVTADISLDRTTLSDQIVFARGETSAIPRVLELSTIDPEADYTVVPSQAVRPREPVNVSASVSTESVYLPMIMDSHTRQSLVTYTKYQEEVARKKITGTAMMYGVEIEPGDLVAITGLGEDFEDTTFKIIETLHGANYSVEFTAEAFMNCGLSGDPYWAGVVLLLGFEDVDGSRGAPGYTDESSRAHGTGIAGSVVGDPAYNESIDTDERKFGLSSLRLPGYGSPSNYGLGIITFLHSDDWSLSPTNSDQYTIELWARFNVFTAPNNRLVGVLQSPGDYRWDFRTVGTAGEFEFVSSSNGSTVNVQITTTGAGLLQNIWYHLAVDKDASGKIRLYKNGVMVASATPANSSIASGLGANLTVGCVPGGNGVNGWLDEIRITKGICRYGSDGGFPVPTSAFPRGGV